jgi:integrase
MITAQEVEPGPIAEENIGMWGPTTTVNDAIAAWQQNGWEDLSPSTTQRYDNLWKVHIRTGIGRRRIATLTPYELERWYRELKRKGLSEASVRQARAILHRACRLARKWSGGLLPNPVHETELPNWSLHEQGDAVRAPSLDEVRRLLAAAAEYEPRFGVLLRLVAATGARRGEICALRWSDIDFAIGSVRFDEAIVMGAGITQIRGPKTRASVRQVALDVVTLSQLQAYLSTCRELARECGVSLNVDGFVFTSDPSGREPQHPDTVSHAFAAIRAKAGVPKELHLHSLRHFHATALDPVISERQKQARLGWATAHMARHYTDAIDAEDRRAAVHVGALLDGDG